MVRRETWYLIVLLVALVGLTLFLNRRERNVALESTPTSGLTSLFGAEDGQPTSIEIAPLDGETVRVARNAQGAWAIELPFAAAADQGLAEAAATQVSTLRILDEVQGDPEIFGLDSPTYVISIGFSTGEEHILKVGSATPTNSGYYVRLDDAQMVIVSLTGLDALLNLATTPPYLETPTASPLPPTDTPTPAPTGSATPRP